MKSKRLAAKGKKINPHFWVFCEGKTEETYICFLRSLYRLPIEIITKIAGCDINTRYIKSYKSGKPTHKKDLILLVYDADIPEIVERLKKIPSITLIASNPAIELWFLLHYKNQTTPITGEGCIKQLNNINRNIYKKGIVDDVLKIRLSEKCIEACKRAKRLTVFDNPSTNMYVFIEILQKVKDEKNI